ncbi:aromatic ring-hydroxylating dioxygenase subunit alpha [Herbiconiux moechotypicola]|uniref:Molybdenum cofactor-independent xanthine hydroxylase subunit HpxD n=1 Tax=Herbiconiux moechotypicola TaxID=637393 RepID=A0ABN3DEU9_9MICO|nr:aromatic ring-hydroxylating dioxygenase subunit alpha [Herbiconiux moechotypicola]MCS5729335.1 aromatic ring-hydroxylating dioxygenase subunit alpha [Herbiconiux moechotypicola]
MADRFEPVLLDNDDTRLRRAWHPVGRSVDVGAEPFPARLLGTPLTLVRDGVVARAGHGREDEPHSPVRVVEGEAWGVQEIYGLVWVALEPPVAELPRIPEWFDPAYHSAVLTRTTTVGAGVLIDNFLDVTHFSYLHRQSFGRAKAVTDEGYSIIAKGDFVQLQHDTVLQEGRRQNNGEFGQRRIATYTYWPVYITHLQMYFPVDGDEAAATLVCQPESSDLTRAYVLVLIPRTDPGLDDQVRFSRQVLDEDLVIVERMADPRLCLSVRSELHTRADRAAVEMRRTLSDFLDACTVAQSTDAASAGASVPAAEVLA